MFASRTGKQAPLLRANTADDLEDSAYCGSETLSESRDSQDQNSSQDHCHGRGSSASAAEMQLRYNHDRHEISRSIAEASKLAQAFKVQATNADWPMQIPCLSPPNTRSMRPSCARGLTTQDSSVNGESPKRISLKRTSTCVNPEGDGDTAADTSPAVLSPEIQQRLQILRPELLMGSYEENIIHTMNPKAVGDIMEKQFVKVEKHLGKLQVRVEDISSKVLVTGDLNAGKSTLCNALLRQKLLPMDQQPCTEVFCELLDSRDNEDLTEVHAVMLGKKYQRDDHSSYRIMSFTELPQLVLQPKLYSSLKVFVDDNRPLTESLVRNGVVDISLIDAPGLNADSLQTTAVYARQEEIDVVVFVVSAENHFTLSAKQFLWNAANEKAYLFIVVNRFDSIKDKDRCRRLILDQVAKLSPRTYADAAELVHFVSADGVLDQHAEPIDEAFSELEIQLRNFVLNKRSQSKLAPAKNFVGKFWSDVRAIASFNTEIAINENKNLQAELTDINGKLCSLAKDGQNVLDKALTANERACEEIRQIAKDTISASLVSLTSVQPEHKYSGLFDCWNFAIALKDQYLSTIQSATIHSELLCRDATARGVDVVRAIGLAHLDAQQYKLKPLNVKVMFSRKRDAIQRKLPVELQVIDFIDFANLETLVGTSSVSAALFLYSGKALGWSALFDTTCKLLGTVGIERSPKLIGGLVAIAASGALTYVIWHIPSALQKNLASKVQHQVKLSDYIDSNANRVSNECRKVLQIPENELRLAFASVVEAEKRCKFAIEKQIFTAAATVDFFRRQGQLIAKEETRLARIVFE